MFLSLLLCFVPPLCPAYPSNSHHNADDSGGLRVTITKSHHLSAVLGGSLSLPCLVSSSEKTPSPALTLGRRAVLTLPRVKWSVLSSGQEIEILEARGKAVRVSETYRDRASLPNYATSPCDLTLRLEGLRYTDSGAYICAVQQGLEDAHDLAPVKVRGVVFHHRHVLGRNAFSFPEAQKACEDNGAQIATPAQLLASHRHGDGQCHGGWLSDQTVRHTITSSGQDCSTHMGDDSGKINYRIQNPLTLSDVYCYVEDISGEVFYSVPPQRLTLKEAAVYCQARGAELATLGQLYAAWNDGLHHCSPGWLADGSVRFPIVTRRRRCGHSDPGVKTIYHYTNQTGFPEPHTQHDVYCFRGNRSSNRDASRQYMITEPEDMSQDLVVQKNTVEKLILGEMLVQKSESSLETSPNGGPQEEHGAIKESPVGISTQNFTIKVYVSQDSLSKDNRVLLQEDRNLENNWSMTVGNLASSENNLTFSPAIPGGNSKHYQPMPETNVEPGDLIQLAEILGNTFKHQGISDADLESGDMSFSEIPGDSSKHYQPMPETNVEPGDLIQLAEILGNTFKHQAISDADLESGDTSFSEIPGDSSKHYQPMPETNVEPGDLIQLAEILGNTFKHQGISDADLESGDTSFSEIPGDSSKHYQPMPETNVEPGDLVQLSEILGNTSMESGEVTPVGSSKHYQPETYLEFGDSIPTYKTPGTHSKEYQTIPDSNLDLYYSTYPTAIPSDVSTQDPSTSKTNLDDFSKSDNGMKVGSWQPVESISETEEKSAFPTVLFDHSRGNFSHFVASTEVHLQGGSLTPTLNSPESIPEKDEKSLLSATSFFDVTGQEEILGEVIYTSVTATPHHEDKHRLPMFSTQAYDLKPATNSPVENIKEQITNLPTAIQTVPLDGAEVLYGKKNISVLTESSDLVTLAPRETHFFTMLKNIEMSRYDGSGGISADTDFPVEQSSTMWTTIPDEIQHVKQEELPSTEGPSGSSDLFSSSYQIITYFPGGSTEYSIDTDITPEKPGTVGPESPIGNAQVEQEAAETLGESSLEQPVESGVDFTQEQPGITWPDSSALTEDMGITRQIVGDLGSNLVDMIDNFLSTSVGSGTNEVSGAITQPDELPVTWKTSPVPMTLAGATTPFQPAEVKSNRPSIFDVHTPDAIISSGLDYYTEEQKTLTETPDVNLSVIPCLDESSLVHKKSTFRKCLQPSTEPGKISEKPTEQFLGSTKVPFMTESPKIPHPTVPGTPVINDFWKAFETTSAATSTGSEHAFFDLDEELSSKTPTPVLEVTVLPRSQTLSWGVFSSPTTPQDKRAVLEYSTEHPMLTSEKIPVSSTEPESSLLTPGFSSTAKMTPEAWPTEIQNMVPSERNLESSYSDGDYPMSSTVISPTRQPTFGALLTEGVKTISDRCLENSCANGGTCVDEGFATKCLCLPTYGGHRCQIDLEPCSPGWEKFQGFCYRHFSEQQSWEVAEQRCRTCGGHLVSVWTPEEQDFVNNKYKEYQWIGLNDRTIEGDFLWSDGSPLLYENWYRGQPDSYFLSGEDCVVMVWHDGGRWSDVPCNYHLSYTCKKSTSSCGEPPHVPNARVFSKAHPRFETNAMVRYYCVEGFVPRLNPVIKCLASGRWEEPQVMCVPVTTAENDKVTATSFFKEDSW